MMGKKSADTDQWYDIEKAKIYKVFFQNQRSGGRRLTSILTSLNIENGQNFRKFKHFWLFNKFLTLQAQQVLTDDLALKGLQ